MRTALACLALCLSSATVTAQTSRPTDPRVDIQLFYPSPGINSFFTTESGEINRHLSFSAGVHFNYARAPLAVKLTSGDPVGSVIENRFDIDFTASFGLFNYVDIGVVFPLVAQGGFAQDIFSELGLPSGALGAPTDFTQGDLRIIPKIRPFSLGEGIFAMSLVPTVVVPTGGGAEYAAERNAVFMPSIALSSTTEFFRAALNIGYRWRDVPTEMRTVGIVIKDDVFAHIGVGFNLNFLFDTPVEIIAEVIGHTPAKNGFGLGTVDPERRHLQQARTAIEGDLGLKIELFEMLQISLGGGGGLAPGYGAPAPRIFLDLKFFLGERGVGDKDKDGINDDDDECPDRVEDFDNYKDEDGCPDLDNDGDNVLDEDDQCPLAAEDRDGFRDDDGCPEPDNDGDTVLDANDKCPLEAEDIDNFDDEDGCPDFDNDNDGIADKADQCPSDPEDTDGFQDRDGCPDLDNDGDGLPDLNDLCPNFAEDLDGVADDDGCPEDNDGDGIPDDVDECPNEAEIYNGIKDEDGCPEKLKVKSLVRVTEEKIEIEEKIFFDTNKATIQSKSFGLLDQVAAVLKNYKHLTKIRIEGHTDSRGSRKKNRKLSQERADSVRTYLLGKGIAAERLVAEGLGPDRPISTNKTNRGREMNRRVEFVIAEQKSIGVDVSTDQEPSPSPEGRPAGEPGAGEPAPASGGQGAATGQQPAGKESPAPASVGPTAPGIDGPLFEVGGDEPEGEKGKKKKKKKKKGKKEKGRIELNF